MANEATVLTGFAYGTEHPMFKAVMAELDAFREAAVRDALIATTDTERCRRLGAVENCDDLKAKFEANVVESIRALEAEEAQTGR